MWPGKGDKHEMQQYVIKILKRGWGLISGEGRKRIGNGEDLEKN